MNLVLRKLYKKVKSNYRYYSLEIYKSIFGEYILEKKYGNLKNKSPTGVIREYYQNIQEVYEAYSIILNKKLKRGYNNYE